MASWMKKKERDHKVIWPEYFDAGSTRKEGRRVPTSRAKDEISLERLKKAAQRAKLKCVAEEARAYPGQWEKRRGRLLVYSNLPKTEIIRMIGKNL